jgi:hypothetical protein
MKILGLIVFFPVVLFTQEFSESVIDTAYFNAKRGIYWCLSNIPDKKTNIDNHLIADDKLISSVRLQKEINGFKIESTGYYSTAEVKITLFKSKENLIKEGFIKPDTVLNNKAGTEKVIKKKKSKK